VERTFHRAASRLVSVFGVGFLLAAAAFIGVTPAAASNGIGVYIGYADSSHPNVTHFPTPWAGSPNVIFEGCPLTVVCVFDAGAVQVINNSGGAVTVNSVAIHVGSCTFSGWPSAVLSVQFTIPSGPNAGRTGSGTTNASGQATFSYVSVATGMDTVSAAVVNTAGSIPANNVAVTWTVIFAPGGGGAFVIGNSKGAPAYWWGAQWWKRDHLSSGLAPASFKGFEKSNLAPWCGQTWTTRPGNSPKPPSTVPGTMAVIVASHVSKQGPVISGDIVHIVLVRTNPGYGPNPGHTGTGTIVAQLC